MILYRKMEYGHNVRIRSGCVHSLSAWTTITPYIPRALAILRPQFSDLGNQPRPGVPEFTHLFTSEAFIVTVVPFSYIFRHLNFRITTGYQQQRQALRSRWVIAPYN